ncbi:MAG: type IV pilus modification protein PilV [Rhizobacter sp.]
MCLPHSSSSQRAQAGFSMIELLVAFVIFSFGMLGLAGLQSKTMAYSQSSLYRSQASALTDDILDRLRADLANAKAGSWNTTLTTAAASVPTSGTGIYSTDLADWKSQVEALLPSGQASIAVNGGVVTIVIQWDDSRAQRTSSTGTPTAAPAFTTTSRL